MRKLILLGVLTTVLLGVSASSASATTFSGSCHVEGTIIMVDSPLTFKIDHHDFITPGKGRCVGTLDGAPFDGPVSYNMNGRMNVPMSCAVGASNDVPATIWFGDDPSSVTVPRVEMFISHVNISSQAPFTVTGAYNGYGVARLQFPGSRENLEACAGDGITEIPAKFDLQTVTPLYG